jgi:predicted nucleic acid-binding Zn ribbon protein
MTKKRGGHPMRISDALSSYLSGSGLRSRVDQAAIIPEWSRLVGPQIASVTEPYAIAADGTMFVGVQTSAWMTELSYLEPDLLEKLNAVVKGTPIRKIRWQLIGLSHPERAHK